jgi:hypothetical protein
MIILKVILDAAFIITALWLFWNMLRNIYHIIKRED